MDLPENVILKIQVAAGDPSAVYGVEAPGSVRTRICGCVRVYRQFGIQDFRCNDCRWL